jgi:hypothetical protein
VVEGVIDYISSFANGVLLLASDLKYYRFDGTGNAGTLIIHGGFYVNGGWRNILNGDLQASFFTYGAIHDNANNRYNAVSSTDGGAYSALDQSRVIRMLPNGEVYVFVNSEISGTALSATFYPETCDQAPNSGMEILAAAPGLNLTDPVVQLGTKNNGVTTYTIPKVPEYSLVNNGYKYSVDAAGLIDDIYTCTTYPD